MNIVTTLIQILLLGAEAVLALMIAYLLLLTSAALFAPRHTKVRRGGPSHRFLILVPAHNEERLLPSLLANLHQLDYPAALYAIHVVADNCTDQTAELARAGGAVAHAGMLRVARGAVAEFRAAAALSRAHELAGFTIGSADTITAGATWLAQS